MLSNQEYAAISRQVHRPRVDNSSPTDMMPQNAPVEIPLSYPIFASLPSTIVFLDHIGTNCIVYLTKTNVMNRDGFLVRLREQNMITVTHRICVRGAKLGDGGRARDLVGTEGRSFRLGNHATIFARESIRRMLYPQQ